MEIEMKEEKKIINDIELKEQFKLNNFCKKNRKIIISITAVFLIVLVSIFIPNLFVPSIEFENDGDHFTAYW